MSDFPFVNHKYTPKLTLAERRKKSLQSYKLALPVMRDDLPPDQIVAHIRNVTDEYDKKHNSGTPLYALTHGETTTERLGSNLGPPILASQVVGVEARHWPEIAKMLEKHAKDGLHYFELTEDPCTTADQVYDRLAREDPERAAVMDQIAAQNG